MAVTVTAAESGTTFNGILLRVRVLTGTAASQAGAATATQAGTAAHQASITTTVTGSQVYGALAEVGGTNFTGAAGTTIVDSQVDSSNGGTWGSCKTTSATGTPGATTVGASAPSTAGGCALLEILPSGTITEDASSPVTAFTFVTTTITTASFTPPPGSLLVAMVSADASTATTVTVSGGALTWTQQVVSQTTGNLYTGVWTAAVPPAQVTAAPAQPAPPPPFSPGMPGTEPFAPWPAWTGAALAPVPPPVIPATRGTYSGVPGRAIPGLFIPGNPGTPPVPLPQAPAPLQVPAWFPGAPGAPAGEPFTPWPQYPVTGIAAAGQDILNAAATVTAVAAASLDVTKAAWVLPPQYPPAWFPSAPSAPGGEPFTPWPLGQTGVNSASLTAASVITATGAAALTESKPLNAASTITAAGAAAETTSKPLNAATTVTATVSASLTVVKAGVTPVPEYPAAWFPAAPGVPGGQPFAPWPVWSGFGGTSVPQDLLTAAAVMTASGAAALTESKPVSAAGTVTATVTASLTTAKPLNAAATVTAARVASLSDVAGPAVPAAMAPLYAPAWFPGQPGLPAAEAFAPWPPWTGALVPAGPPFTIGVLTAGSSPAATLTAVTAAAAPTASLTAAATRTGGPGA